MSSRHNDQINSNSSLKSKINTKSSSASLDAIPKNRKNIGSSSKSSKNNKFISV